MMTVDPYAFEAFEKDFNVFDLQINGIPIWERIRFSVFREIKTQNGIGQAHTKSESGISEHLLGLTLWTKNIIHRNPFFSGDNDFLFIGHQRRKLENDGYWWDIYCDPIHESTNFDYVHAESPYQISHRTPAKTTNLRYLDLIHYSGTLQRKLGLRKPSISDEILDELAEIEAEIERRFDANVDLRSKAYETLYVRKTTVWLYEQLLDRINPSVVVTIVGYVNESLIDACKRKEIPVIELQHGIIYDYHFGYSYPKGETKVAFPDYILTFGEFWNENVRFPIPENRVIPVGYPYLEQRVEEYNDIERKDQIVFISQGTIGAQLSKFALNIHADPRIKYDIIYKLHPGEYDRWRDEYPWLVDSEITVIDSSTPPLYEIFSESSVQVGVGSTAVYEGLCFDLETYIYECEESAVLAPLVEDGSAVSVGTTDELVNALGHHSSMRFDRERFFRSNSLTRIERELTRIANEGTTY